MFSVELPAQACKVGNDVRWDNDVVLHHGRHRRFLEFFNDFGGPHNGLTQTSVFHMKTFKFSFFFGEEVQRCLIDFS